MVLRAFFKPRQQVLGKEEIAYTEYDHYYRPKLRGRYQTDKAASRVVARVLNQKSPHAVSDCVHAEVVLKLPLEEQQRHYTRQNDEEQALVRLSRHYLRVPELDGVHPNAVPRVRLRAVATARKGTAEPPERVRNGYAYRDNGECVAQRCVHVVLQKFDLGAGGDYEHVQIPHCQEADDAADKTALEGHCLAEVEARRRVVDIVVHRLKHHCHEHAERRCEYADKQNLINRVVVEVAPPERVVKEYEATDYPHRHTESVGVKAQSSY